jgi:hypothetical protein
MDSLIRKACELGEKTAHCNVEVILNATQWMEERYRDLPTGKIAAMIALHYWMLAIRSEYRTKPQAIEEHIARALHWWKAATSDQCWNSPGVVQE